MPRFDLSQYVDVQTRIGQFWEKYPDGAIVTELMSDPDDFTQCRYRASVYRHRDDERPSAVDFAFELAGGPGANSTSHEENAATSAIGRALADFGFAKTLADRPSRQEMNKVIAADQQTLTQSVRERPTPAQDALRPVAGPGTTATDAQRRRLWAITKNKWGEEAEARTRGQMWARFKVKHTTELTKGQISQLMDWIEADDLVTEEAIPTARFDPVEAREMVVSELGWALPAEPPRRDAALVGENRYTR
jgi:hypothetical protein